MNSYEYTFSKKRSQVDLRAVYRHLTLPVSLLGVFSVLPKASQPDGYACRCHRPFMASAKKSSKTAAVWLTVQCQHYTASHAFFGGAKLYIAASISWEWLHMDILLASWLGGCSRSLFWYHKSRKQTMPIVSIPVVITWVQGNDWRVITLEGEKT